VLDMSTWVDVSGSPRLAGAVRGGLTGVVRGGLTSVVRGGLTGGVRDALGGGAFGPGLLLGNIFMVDWVSEVS
jgi:hypothetical protein